MTDAVRAFVWRRAKNCCEYCLLPHASSVLPFEIDHIISEKHGGGATEENLALACCYCNRFKGPNISGLDPNTGAIARLYHPRRDKWPEHFFWQGAALVGRSPVGARYGCGTPHKCGGPSAASRRRGMTTLFITNVPFQ